MRACVLNLQPASRKGQQCASSIGQTHAAKHGGFWVSAAGGTANVAAGEISRATGVSFEEAHHALDVTGESVWGSPDWYSAMGDAQPWPADVVPFDDERGEWYCRWDARTIARAATRIAQRPMQRPAAHGC